MTRPWEADPQAEMKQRVGKSPQELGITTSTPDCPDIWELSNGDFAFIGRDLTKSYVGRLPQGVSLGSDERLVVIPRSMVAAARAEFPDA